MEEIVTTYQKKFPFDIEALRDQRLRHHFADRYDYWRNAIDWDFQFSFVVIVSTKLQSSYLKHF
jgi:hypothetical protein